MTTSKKATSGKATSKAVKPATVKATKAATVTTGSAKAVATALAEKLQAPVKQLSDEKQALNKAFLAVLPTARPIFQAKFKPLNLEAHKPTHATDRDTAFIKAIKSVYGNKPFTQQQSGADSGNLARAIALKLVTSAGELDGKPAYKLAA